MQGERGGEVEVLLEAVGGETLELVTELVVKVAGFEDELLVEDVLVDGDVEGAGALGGDGANVEGGDGRLVAGLIEQGGEAGELIFEGWLLDAGGDVGAEAGATEDAMAGTNGDVGEAETRGSGSAVEMVAFDGTAEGVKDAMMEVALELERVEEVGAAGLLVEAGSGIVEAAALVFVVEAEEEADAIGEGVVGLVVELVAVVDVVEGW